MLDIYYIVDRLNIACRICNYGLTRLGGMAIFGAYRRDGPLAWAVPVLAWAVPVLAWAVTVESQTGMRCSCRRATRHIELRYIYICL